MWCACGHELICTHTDNMSGLIYDSWHYRVKVWCYSAHLTLHILSLRSKTYSPIGSGGADSLIPENSV